MFVCSTMIFRSSGRRDGRARPGEAFPEKRVGGEEQVDEPGPGDLHPVDSGQRPDFGRHFSGDLAGIALELFGQGHGERKGEVAEFRLGRIEKIDVGRDDGVPVLQPFVETARRDSFRVSMAASL